MNSKIHHRLLFGGALISAGIAMGTPAHADTFNVTNPGDAGPGTLRQAVIDANANPGADTIEMTVNAFLGPGDMVISDPVTINGNFNGATGSYSGRLFNIYSTGAGTVINDLSISGFQNTGGNVGGAIASSAAGVVINNCSFTFNQAADPGYTGLVAGGAIGLLGGDMTINDSEISYNYAISSYDGTSAFGGGVIAYAGTINLNNCDMAYNFAIANENAFASRGRLDGPVTGLQPPASIGMPGVSIGNGVLHLPTPIGGLPFASGGGLYVENGTAVLDDCEVNGNYALAYDSAYGGQTTFGGGIRGLNSTMSITDCNVFSNAATIGGGIATQGSPYGASVNDSFVHSNFAYTYQYSSGTFVGLGGGWVSVNESASASNTEFEFNFTRIAGAVLTNYSYLQMDRCTVADNYAADYAAGVLVYGDPVPAKAAEGPYSYGYMSVSNSLFRDNFSPDYGALHFEALTYTTAYVDNCTIVQNSNSTTIGHAAGLSTLNAFVNVTGSILYFNESNSVADQAAQISLIAPTAGIAYSVSYSDIQGLDGGLVGTNGLINDDPLFVNAADNDFNLQPWSPCIDAGAGSPIKEGKADLAGNPRFVDDFAVTDNGFGTPIEDMGALERQTDSAPLAPFDTFNLPLGTVSSGDGNSLAFSDDGKLVIEGELNGSGLKYRTRLIYKCTSANLNPSRIDIRFETGTNDDLTQEPFQKLFLWNFNTGSWRNLNSGFQPADDTVLSFTEDNNLTRFIDQTTGEIRLRVFNVVKVSNAPTGSFHNMDEINVFVTP